MQTNSPNADKAVRLLLNSYEKDKYPKLSVRKNWIHTIETLVLKNQDEFAKNISEDFMQRSKDEMYLTEVLPVISAARHAKKNLKIWMKPKKIPTSPIFWFGKSKLICQPQGVVLIISPWNYPLQLSLIPTINALSAGNRVIIKPSEKTPKFSLLLEKIISTYFDKSIIQVLNGDLSFSKDLLSNENLNHIFFTGSTEIGKEVAKNAAKNLIPTTLELGGKSPTYVAESADLKLACARIAKAKYLNCGQTCVAPDYLIVNSKHKKNFIHVFLQEAEKLYESGAFNKALTLPLNSFEDSRLENLTKDAVSKGAIIYPSHKIKQAITVIIGCTDEMKIMKEEIFGYLLPVLFMESTSEAINYINSQETPLALYLFTRDSQEEKKWLMHSKSGGVTINDCVLHVVQDNLPFGGMGKSGYGHYHGEWGFNNFSKQKPIFSQSKYSLVRFFLPPFGKFFNKFAKFLKYFV